MQRGDRTLSPTDERELFRQLNSARMEVLRLRKVARSKRGRKLNKTDYSNRSRLGRATRRWRSARESIIKANFGLVMSMAKNSRAKNVEFNELVSEGLLILTRCVEKFQVTKGNKFSTYVCTALSNGFIRLGMMEQKKHGFCITDHDGAVESSVQQETDDTKPLGQLITSQENHDLREAIDQLPRIQRDIVKRRFGFIKRPGKQYVLGDSWTLEEVGELLGITKERVRQIQQVAVNKLRDVWYDSVQEDEDD